MTILLLTVLIQCTFIVQGYTANCSNISARQKNTNTNSCPALRTHKTNRQSNWDKLVTLQIHKQSKIFKRLAETNQGVETNNIQQRIPYLNYSTCNKSSDEQQCCIFLIDLQIWLFVLTNGLSEKIMSTSMSTNAGKLNDIICSSLAVYIQLTGKYSVSTKKIQFICHSWDYQLKMQIFHHRMFMQ